MTFIISFLIPFNFLLMPGNEDSLRATDAIALILCGIFIFYIVLGSRLTVGFLFFYICLLGAMIPRAILGFTGGDSSTLILFLRFAAYLPAGFVLANLFLERSNITVVMFGILAGTMANILVMWLQSIGLQDELVSFGLAPVDASKTWVFLRERFTGLWQHPNAAEAVVSLCIPGALSLYVLRRARIWILLVTLLGMVASFSLTDTRAPLVLGAITIFVIMSLHESSFKQILIYTFLPVIAAAGLMLLAPEHIDRWSDHSAIAENTDGRLDTNFYALASILTHLLGQNILVVQDELLRAFGLGSGVHNGYLFFGMIFGLIPFLGAIGTTFLTLRRTLKSTEPGMIAIGIFCLHILLLMFTEDHFLNPTFILLWSVCVTAIFTSQSSFTEQTTIEAEDNTPATASAE